MSHTPGPWFATDWHQDDGPNTFAIVIHEPEVLAQGQSSIWPGGIRKSLIASTEEGDGDRVGNARLIAAAPDLLYALRILKRLAELKTANDLPTPDEIKIADAAITKATGGVSEK